MNEYKWYLDWTMCRAFLAHPKITSATTAAFRDDDPARLIEHFGDFFRAFLPSSSSNPFNGLTQHKIFQAICPTPTTVCPTQHLSLASRLDLGKVVITSRSPVQQSERNQPLSSSF